MQGTRFMENHIQLSSGVNSNSYIRQFQVAQMNFHLVNQEEKIYKKKFRWRSFRSKAHETR